MRCPACPAALREHINRLVCDACDGILLTEADLRTAIGDLTGMEPELEYFRQQAGKRKCPRCSQAMAVCRLRVAFPVKKKRPRTRPKLDRCEHHGVWFDAEELAKVLEVCSRTASSGPRGGGASLRGTAMPGGGRSWGFGAR